MQATPDTPENWDAASRGYAEHIAPVLMRAFADATVERLGVDESTEALEVGAGSGAVTEVLAPRVRSLLATDFAPRMIELLRARLDAAGIGNVRCEVMDGQALALDDASFDAAVCGFALMLFPDRARGFAELNRVLRPGGRVAVTGWAGPDRFEAFGLFLDGVRAALPVLPPPPTPPPVFSLADPAAFRAEMGAAGFREIEVEFVTRELVLPDFDRLWSILTAGAPPVQMLFDRVGPDGRDRIRAALRSIVEERFGDGPIAIKNTATLGSGVAP